MNERIVELTVLADRYAWDKVGKKYNDDGQLNWKWEDVKLAKFAELIVKECCAEISQEPFNAGSASAWLKEHFGV